MVYLWNFTFMLSHAARHCKINKLLSLQPNEKKRGNGIPAGTLYTYWTGLKNSVEPKSFSATIAISCMKPWESGLRTIQRSSYFGNGFQCLSTVKFRP